MSKNTLENGVEIEGVVKFSGEMALDCKLKGEIISEKGDLTLNPNSNIKGDIKAGQVTIKGKVEGSVQAETCKLQSTADVNGDLVYKSLGMEPGAKMVGSTKML